MKEFTTTSAEETQKMGKMLAQELKGGKVICLEGELGSGKTTFTQGLLKGLEAEGPYTSPTFLVMKHYESKPKTKNKKPKTSVYHFDAYRVNANDVLSLGWEEIINNPENVVIVEWADRIKSVIPGNALRLRFEWQGENERKIKFEISNSPNC